MIDRFLILDHDAPRPDAERVIFCDGSGGDLYREGADLDLSHWRPNRTPWNFRADTSTEICFRFLDNGTTGGWTLAVNNHLDVDGMLSVYALVESEHARCNRRTIVQAAEMGDFWGWGEPPAQRLFQGLTRLMNRGKEAQRPVQAIYEEAFRRIPAIVDERDPESAEIKASLEPLWAGIALVKSGAIRRTLRGPRFSQYLISRAVVGDEIERTIYIPKFNEQISRRALLWPQARAKWDGQRVSLVSAEGARGWHHDVWFPGYLWADVENRWVVPGMSYRNGMESYDLDLPAFDAAIATLNAAEGGQSDPRGEWTLGNRAFMFNATIQGQFPVVARVLDGAGNPTVSTLEPDHVAEVLLSAFRFE